MGKKILIVDDELELLKLVSFRIKKFNYEIFGAITG
jgi:DNA-binding response OmpR family regulator